MKKSPHLLVCLMLMGVYLASFFVATGCRATYIEDFREDVTGEDLAQLEDKIGFNFPSESVPLGIWITHVPNETISLKLSMTEIEVDEMLASSPFERKDLLGAFEYSTDESEQANFPPNRNWWNPGAQDELRVGSKSAQEGGLISLGVLKGQGRKMSTVYLTWDALPVPTTD